jgi:hypothetical protein
MKKIIRRSRKKKKIDDYIKKRIQAHKDPDIIKDIAFNSLKKAAIRSRKMPEYASDKKDSNNLSDYEEELSKEEE